MLDAPPTRASLLVRIRNGRDQEAWRTLADMWPPGDFDRIRRAILSARARGIRSQIDEVSVRVPRFHLKKRAYVFDAMTEPPEGSAGQGHFPFVDTRPQPILLRRAPRLPDTVRWGSSGGDGRFGRRILGSC